MKRFFGILMGLICMTGVVFGAESFEELTAKQINDIQNKIAVTTDCKKLNSLYSQLSTRYFSINDYKNTLFYMDKCKDEFSLTDRSIRGTCFRNLKEYENAIKEYSIIIESKDAKLEDKKDGLYYRGMCYRHLWNFKQAEQDICQSYNIPVNYPAIPTGLKNMPIIDQNKLMKKVLLLELSKDLEGQGKYKAAIEVIDTYLKNNSKEQSFLIRKAELLYELGQYTQCNKVIAQLEKIKAHYPNIINIINILKTKSFIGNKQFDKACKYFDNLKVCDDDEINIDYYLLKSQLALQNNNFEEALTNVQTAIDIESTPSGIIMRGNIYAAMGEKNKAIADYKYFLSKSQNVVKNAEVQEKLKKLE